MLVHMWEFYVNPSREREFEALNGPQGPWAKYFSGHPDFLGTGYLRDIVLSLKDEKAARRYITQDRWQSEEGFQRFVAYNQKEYNRLSEENYKLLLTPRHLNRLGWFQVTDK